MTNTSSPPSSPAPPSSPSQSTQPSPYLTIHQIPIHFSQDWSTGIGGGLWSTGLAMAKYFQRHHERVYGNLECLSRIKCLRRRKCECLRREMMQLGGVGELNGVGENSRKETNVVDGMEGMDGISALELGSGNGFLSICLLAVLASHQKEYQKAHQKSHHSHHNHHKHNNHHKHLLNELVVTDLADHLSLIASTCKANSHVWDCLRVVPPANNIDGGDGSDGGGDDGDDGAGEMCFEGTLNERTEAQCSTGGAGHAQSQNQRVHPVTVTVAEHAWGTFPPKPNPNPNAHPQNSKATPYSQHSQPKATNIHQIHHKKYDFIFGTDLAYKNSLHQPLLSSLLHFSHPHTLILIGVTMNDTQPIFFDLLTEVGFRYERLADHWMEGEFRGREFGLFAIQRRS